jgi:hypothetical protein
MRPEEIKELLDRDPFLPFRVFLADGQTFDVTRPHAVALGRTGMFIVLPDDRWKIVPLRHVTSIETLQAA